MEYLISAQDESDRRYQSLLDVSNAAVRGRSKSLNVIRVFNIKIKLETQPAR
jgi:hypothetical protein